MRRIVVTGAPGTGKTGVMSLLGDRHVTVKEPARDLIAVHAAETGEATLDGRPELFLRSLVQRSIDDFNSVSNATVVFFDRGLPDCVAYAAVFGINPEQFLRRPIGSAMTRRSSLLHPGRRSTRATHSDERTSNRLRRSISTCDRLTSGSVTSSSNCPELLPRLE